MDFIDNLCMNCFENIGDENICPNCGFNNNTSLQDMIYLPLKTVLSDRYIVGNHISYESDAITYLGYDMERRTVVTVREFIPKDISNRLEGNLDVHVREKYRKNFENYKNSFINLWKTLKSISSLSAVIPVLDVFEENGTAYAISEKMETLSLREFLLRTEDNNILWDKARLMFMPVLTTIENLHEHGIIHGGINPDNLVLCRDGKVRLLGFCISECNVESSELEFNHTDGYTALEQYVNNHKVCPATDIYAFSACIYRALVGSNPPDAPSRETNDKLMIPNRIAEKIPAHVIKALGGGLQIYPENRIQNVYDFREFLNAAPSVVAKSAVSKKEEPKEEKPVDNVVPEEKKSYKEYKEDKKKKNIKIIIITLVSLLVVATAVYVIGFSGLVIKKETPTVAAPISVTVPDFCSAGYTESDVKSSGTWNNQFNIQFKYEYSTKIEEGIVFQQSVEAGKTVDSGTTIVLTVSKGIETVKVPDVSGLTKDEAVKKLEEAGLVAKIVYIYNDSNHTPDTVKASGGMAPKYDTEIAKGEEVMVQVYGEVVTEPATEATTEPTTGEKKPSIFPSNWFN